LLSAAISSLPRIIGTSSILPLLALGALITLLASFEICSESTVGQVECVQSKLRVRVWICNLERMDALLLVKNPWIVDGFNAKLIGMGYSFQAGNKYLLFEQDIYESIKSADLLSVDADKYVHSSLWLDFQWKGQIILGIYLHIW